MYIPCLFFHLLHKHVLSNMMTNRTTAVAKIPFPISDPIRLERSSKTIDMACN